MTASWKLRTVTQAIEDAAASTKTGYRFIDESSEAEPSFTHGGVERTSARIGGALQALGLQKGDRVALILPDNADFIFTFLGAIRAGIIPVPIYPPTGMGKLSGYLENTLVVVAKSGAKVLITNAEIKRMLGTIQAQAPELQQVVASESLRGSRAELKPVKIGLDDTCFLQFTSGSTSRPKGVVLTHANIASNVRAIKSGLGIRDGEDSAVSWLPLYHDMGLIGFVLAPLFHVNTVTFLPPLLFLKRPVRWLETLSRHHGNVSFGPNFAYALCVKRIRDPEIAGLDLSNWRIAGCGAEPIRAENLRAFAAKFAPVGFNPKAFICCYGMAESTLAVSFSKRNAGVEEDTIDSEALWLSRKAVPTAATSPGALSIVPCGPAFEDHEISAFALDDAESAHPLSDREVGELRLRGPSMMTKYFNDPVLTQEAFAGGWFRTGDLGYIADGNVHICGRSKDVIIVNGRNYYPQDLEWEASRVPGVRQGNVIAFGTMKPSNDRERVIIVFETGVNDPDEKRELKGEVRRVVQQAMGLTVDDVVAVTGGVLPKTSSGKLKRNATRELYEHGELLDRTPPRKSNPVEAAADLAKSQFGYIRHAILRTRGD